MRPTPGWIPKILPLVGTVVNPDAVFVNGMLTSFEMVKGPAFVDPTEFKTWGVPLYVPTYGGVCVYNSGGSDIVGFCVGRSNDNKIAVMAADSGGTVGVSMIPIEDIESWRWPSIVRVPYTYPLPLWTGPVI